MHIILSLKSLIARFITPSVDSALLHFHHAKAKLQQAVEHHEAQADIKAGFADKLVAEADAHESEALRATRVINKIEQFLI